MAADAADMLVGVGPNRPHKAWAHALRSIQHGEAKTACEAARQMNISAQIKTCADTFVNLQQMRHNADYDPALRVLRAHAITAIDLGGAAIRNLKSAPRKDRKAFAVQLLLKKRRS